MNKKDKKIVLVDDDEIHNFLTENFLKDLLPESVIEPFQNPIEALEHLEATTSEKKENCPDVIFLDINMPEINGWQFLEEYIKMKIDQICNSRIFILSSSVDPDDINRSKTFPVVANFISKPLTKDKVLNLLH